MTDDRRQGERRKSPAFSMYAKDYLASEDITLMPPEAEGLFNRCLMLSWDNIGLPIRPQDVLKLAGTKYAKCWKKAWPPVRKKFVRKGRRLFNPRQEIERAKQKDRADKATEAAKARWGQCEVDANASAEHGSEYGVEQSLAFAVASAVAGESTSTTKSVPHGTVRIYPSDQSLRGALEAHPGNPLETGR